METETPQTAPILSIAWTRYAQLNAVAIGRSRAYRRLRVCDRRVGRTGYIICHIDAGLLFEMLKA